MRFDAVHDTQRVFRGLLHALSFPGSIGSIREATEGIEVWASLGTPLAGIALTLLDAETTFCLWPRSALKEQDLLAHLTYARPQPPENAQFHFVPAGGDVLEAARSAATGTFVEPHRGATLVLEAGEITPEGPWLLEGPGIKSTARLGVSGIDAAFIRLRAERCSEYPLGIDVFIVDSVGRLAALPRTTRVRVEA
jgi:alpha-D-ribose 1-methylphosphonate 5-triphosphate synthase subunit PhnH